jgi:uncharacterized protein (DUF2267 family)
VETPHVFFTRLATISGISDETALRKLTASVLAELRAMVAPGEANYVRQQLPLALQELWGPAITDPLSVDFTFPRPDADTLIARVKEATGLADARRALQATFVVLDEALADPAVVTLLHSVSPSVKQLWVTRDSVLNDLKL